MQGCAPSLPGEKWLPFAGGFYTPAPACVPVIVRAGDQERRVKIGLGKQSTGQTAPVPSPVP